MSVKYVERKGTGSRKWDGMWNKFGSDDLIAMWIADMDFELAEPIKNALKDHIDKYPLGYSIPPESYYENFIEWEKKYHGYEVKRDWICFGCGIVVIAGYEHDCCAVVFGCLDLGNGGRLRHADDGLDAQQRSRIGDALSVVTG